MGGPMGWGMAPRAVFGIQSTGQTWCFLLLSHRAHPGAPTCAPKIWTDNLDRKKTLRDKRSTRSWGTGSRKVSSLTRLPHAFAFYWPQLISPFDVFKATSNKSAAVNKFSTAEKKDVTHVLNGTEKPRTDITVQVCRVPPVQKASPLLHHFLRPSKHPTAALHPGWEPLLCEGDVGNAAAVNGNCVEIISEEPATFSHTRSHDSRRLYQGQETHNSSERNMQIALLLAAI